MFARLGTVAADMRSPDRAGGDERRGPNHQQHRKEISNYAKSHIDLCCRDICFHRGGCADLLDRREVEASSAVILTNNRV
ncbi:hypothetical protein ACFQ4K_20580 [Tistrella bauzanensis]